MTHDSSVVVGTREARGAATAAATETLLNCYIREADSWRIEPAGGLDVSGDGAVGLAAPPGWIGATPEVLVLPVRDGTATVVAPIRYRSRTFRHRYLMPVHLVVGGRPAPLTFPALAGLLLEELTPVGAGATGDPAGEAPASAVPEVQPVTLLARMVESVQNVAEFLTARVDEVDRLWSADPLGFVESEQALLLGHPLHPTPKSRGEMNPRERRTYSPEHQGTFRLRWLAARPGIVQHGSATGTPAPELVERMLRADPATDGAGLDRALAEAGGERILLPAHPWELEHLRPQPEVAELLAHGDLVDLGPYGSPVTPTTSVRTVYGPGWEWQLKFSLHVAVTNSLRVTLPKELDRAVEAFVLRQSSLGQEAARIAPAFAYVDDPAYLTLALDGRVLDGFSVLLRQNRWPEGSSADVSAVTTLCQDHPFGGGPSRLGALVHRLADERGIPVADAGRVWFDRFCQVAVVSLVRLYLDAGLCFEPHQQNTLLELDREGLPERCVYRDSQGYFHREAAHDDVVRVLPGLGEVTESIFPEALADQRLVYYPFMNLTLGVVNALGAAGCGDEAVLLADLRHCLETERELGGRYPATLLDRLLDDPRWPCKGNLRTRLHDMDELVGDIETQSVYVTVPNPLVLP